MRETPPRFPGRAPIDAYGNGGFRFAGLSHRGSLLCLPSGIYVWEPAEAGAVRLDHVQPVVAERTMIDVLLFGAGDRPAFPSVDVRNALAEAGLGLETMDTGAACRTYNVLLAEGRRVAAALIAVQ
ncbi:MAG: Mth938-like domain-containing protein [Hyphomicrobiaceae bacterium]